MDNKFPRFAQLEVSDYEDKVAKEETEWWLQYYESEHRELIDYGMQKICDSLETPVTEFVHGLVDTMNRIAKAKEDEVQLKREYLEYLKSSQPKAYVPNPFEI